MQIETSISSAHRLILAQRRRAAAVALQPCSVADFYAEVHERLHGAGVDIHIWTMPSEIEGAIPFERDRGNRTPPTTGLPRNSFGANWCRPIA